MSDSGRRRTVIILGLAVVAACAWATARRFVRPIPIPLSQASAIPESVSQVDSSWYWLERPAKAKVRLVRVADSKSETIAEADDIPGYFVAGDKITWSERTGKQWRVMAGPASGQKAALWTGSDVVGRPCFDGSRVLWAVAQAGPLHDITYVPALGPVLTIYAADQGGAPTIIAKLSETDGNLLNVQSGAAFVSARHDTVVYKVSLGDGKYKRVAASASMSQPVIDKKGTLLWVAGSKDTRNIGTIVSINSLSSTGSVVTSLDWVPVGGEIYATTSGNFYVDGAVMSAIWPIYGNDRLPTPINLRDGYLPVAAGERDLLLRGAILSRGAQQLSTVPMP